MNERERLEQVIASENMTAKQFASEVGIQAGTISNILNGRNNPSLDVLQRVLNRFRTLSTDWLILGIGSMYRAKSDSTELSLFDIRPETPALQDTKTETTPPDAAITYENVKETRSVSKIVIFYTDGTFEER